MSARLRVLLLPLAIMAAQAQAAPVAVPATETRPDGTQERVTRAHRLSAGLVQRFRPAVSAMLAEVPGSAGERRALERLSAQWRPCLRRITDVDNEVRVRPATLRGPLAEALLESEAGGAALVPFPAFDQVARSELASLPLRRFADCAVAARPGEGRALLATAPASVDERAEVQRIVREHDACFPAGIDVDINIPDLRGFVAEALYRRAQAGGPGR